MLPSAPPWTSSPPGTFHQDYMVLKNECKALGVNFNDPEFKADESVLVHDESPHIVESCYGTYEMKSIKWMRPKEICANPQMVVNGSVLKINQGDIGNCWFLAAMQNLDKNEEIFKRVVPQGQSFEGNDYCGIFRFRFWRFGQWTEIVIDDFLPTQNGKLIYLNSVEHGFWSVLLEKAYAKLHGSYKALEGGLAIEAAVDFTGGVPEIVRLHGSKSPINVLEMMMKANDRDTFIGCSINDSVEARQLGLQPRHAYIVSKVVEVRPGNMLIKVKNPHGKRGNWKGDWYEGDPNWRTLPNELGLTFEDGDFYMNFVDFMKFFGKLEVCHIVPHWFDTFDFRGQWTMENSGGCGNQGIAAYSRNPQFFLNVSNPVVANGLYRCPVFICLTQRVRNRNDNLKTIGFKVYKCGLEDNCLDEKFLRRNASVDRTNSFINLRDLSKYTTLKEGRYCIIPSTYKTGKIGEFLLRVFVQRNWGTAV